MSWRNKIVGLVLGVAASLSWGAQGQDRTGVNVSTAVPQILIETAVPGEINIGGSARFVISVKNSGRSPAEGISIQTTLPASVRFVKADPSPAAINDRLIQFEIGDLAPGAVQRLILELVPERTGPVDLQTKAFFSASTQAAMQVRQPEVTLECHGPETAQIGEIVTFRVVVRNIGDGIADSITLKPTFPESSYVESQPPRLAKIAALAAGKSQEFTFTARATEPEWLVGAFTVSAPGNREVECSHRVKVLRPDLRVELNGTRVSFLQTEGEYELHVWNPGDTSLCEVKVALQIPEGLEVVTLSEKASIDQAARIYSWCLATMDPGASHKILLKTKAAMIGPQIQLAVAMSGPKLRADAKHLTHVISRADVDVAVSNAKEALRVGSVEEFTVLVVNRGSRDADTVSLTVELPMGIEATAGDGYQVEGNRLAFPGFRLAAGASKVMKFRAIGTESGDQAVRAVIETDYSHVPTLAETTVYFYDEDELQRIARDLDATIRVR